MEDELEQQRMEGIKKALKVTELLGRLKADCDTVRVAVAGLEDANKQEDPKLKCATKSVADTLHKLTALMSAAANRGDEEEYDKLHVVTEGLLGSVITATEQAEADAGCTEKISNDDTLSSLTKVNDASAEAGGLPAPRYSFALKRTVQESIVLISEDNIAHCFNGAAFLPFSEDEVRSMHILAGEREVAVPFDDPDTLYMAADGKYCAATYGLCRIDQSGRHIITGQKGSSIIRVGDTLIVANDTNKLVALDLNGDGKWVTFSSDEHHFVSVAVVQAAQRELVGVTIEGAVLKTPFMDPATTDIRLFDHAEWSFVPGTTGRKWISIGSRAPQGLCLMHPDGRVLKLDDKGVLRLDDGTDLALKMTQAEDVHGRNQGFSALFVSGTNLALMHFNYVTYAQEYCGNDFTFAWKFVDAPDGVYVYNDFAQDSWLGYDYKMDAVVIVNERDPTRVAWKVHGA